MKELLPIGGHEWDEVLHRHSIRYPERDVESLRRKFSELHRRLAGAGNPVCPTEVKLAKRLKYLISQRADTGDGNEVMDLATGAFVNPDDEGEETGDEEEHRLDDEVSGEFARPNVPDDDLVLLDSANNVNHNLDRNLGLEANDDDSVLTSDIGVYQPLPPRRAPLVPLGQDTTSSVAAAAPPGPGANSRTSTRARPKTRTTRATTPTTSMGSTSARPLVSPYDRKGNKGNPSQDGLEKILQLSTVQHDQQMAVDRLRQDEMREDRKAIQEDRKAMQDMLAQAVTGAFKCLKQYTKNNKDKDSDDE
jgi:hypothetical protein